MKRSSQEDVTNIKEFQQFQQQMQRSLTQCQIIPNRIILRNNKYAQRKILINKKFEWLNKYISSASPQIFNASSFTVQKKANGDHKRNKSYMSGSRLKTSYQNASCEKNVLATKNANNELRKTASSQFYIKPQKVEPPEESSIARFFRCRRTKTQFSKKSKTLNQNRSNLRSIEDSQIKPWNIQILSDDENECFKENAEPLKK